MDNFKFNIEKITLKKLKRLKQLKQVISQREMFELMKFKGCFIIEEPPKKTCIFNSSALFHYYLGLWSQMGLGFSADYFSYYYSKDVSHSTAS